MKTLRTHHAFKALAILTLITSAGLIPRGAQARGGQEKLLSLGGDIGFGGLGGTAYATVQTGVDIREGGLAVGLFGRMRLALHETSGEGLLRKRDFDEVSDFVHIQRYATDRRQFGKL